MNRMFVMTAAFDKQWKHMGLDDDDLRRLQQAILQDPKVGDVIPGTGRLRKMRFALEGRGKRGSARVTYVDFLLYQTVYLIYAYPKNEKENLTKEECNQIKKMIDAIEKALGQEGAR